MAVDPVTAYIAKKVAVEAAMNPKKTGQTVAIIIGSAFVALILIIGFPFLIATNFSVVTVTTNNPELTAMQMKVVQKYRDAVKPIDKKNLDWINKKEEELLADGCESVEISYDFDLIWEQILAIDSVKLGQIFEIGTLEELAEARKSEIIALGESFMQRSAKKERRTRTVTYTSTDTEGNVTTTEETEEYYVGVITVKTMDFQEILVMMGFDEEQQFVATNIYFNLTNTLFDENGQPLNPELDVYPEGGADIPYYSQKDARWGNKPYGTNGSISQAGCGPTSLAMVVSGLTGRVIYPDEMADWAYRNGYMAPGAGSYWSLMDSGAEKWGLKSTPISRTNPNAILKSLSEGNPVIMSCGVGYFTNFGHFIVLTGLTEDGKITVNDPWSYKKSQETYDIRFIINESSKNGGVNGSPFWSISR